MSRHFSHLLTHSCPTLCNNFSVTSPYDTLIFFQLFKVLKVLKKLQEKIRMELSQVNKRPIPEDICARSIYRETTDLSHL